MPDKLFASIDLNKIRPLKIFKWLKKNNISEKEMLKTFNCGIGMSVICSKASRDVVFSLLEKNGESPTLIGEVTDTNKVHYSGNLI